MFSQLDTSDSQSFNLRRPYSARRGNGFQNTLSNRPTPVFDYTDGHLDLSMHHPSTPFGNRFAPLTRPEASVQRDIDIYASRPHRRSRNSRGTKEAKKRRDSRRNKRKFAVHSLNEQLSNEIGDTLCQYNIHPSPLTGPAPEVSTMPTTSVSQHIYGNGSTHVAPSAPQLPPITFHGFSLPDLPPLVIPRASPSPSPTSISPGVPAWCPPVPSLTSVGTGGELPKFYDLSCLKEPARSMPDKEKTQSLQLWKRSPATIPRKQSRFFPPRPTSPKPRVRLPPTGPKYEIPGAGLHDPADEAWKASSFAAKQDSITQAMERIIAAARIAKASDTGSQLPSAANLWNILTQPQQELAEHPSDSNVDWEERQSSIEVPPLPRFNGELGPFELAGSDVPYVHTNSLTGYANETAARHSENDVLGDSAIYLADMFASRVNRTPLHDLYSIALTPSPCESTPALSSCDASTTNTNVEAFVNVVVDTRADSSEEMLDDSAAHFNSEQELFARPPPQVQPIQSPAESVCDLATFLSMGHAEHCWCLTCEEEPELVSEATVMESEESFIEDDGWLVWSTGSDDVPISADGKDDQVNRSLIEQESTHIPQGSRSETWDDFFPRKPRRARALLQSEPDAQFLGYFDDGAAFAHFDEDEWE